MRMLLEEGADANISEQHGITPLMIASFYGHITVVELLLRAGSIAELKNNDGFSALELAKSQGRGEVVRLLECHGARL